MIPLQKILPFPANCVCGNIDCIVPYGYCHCGCGEKTHINNRSRNSLNQYKGRPARYVNNHHGNYVPRETLPDGVCVCRNPKCQIPYGKCHCGCEKETSINTKNNIKRDEIRGKPQKFLLGHHSLRHGHSIHGQHRTYKSWIHMIRRCTNPAQESYEDYGGRGITVCMRWMKYENFYDDMGDRPNGMTIDRIDNDKGYFPDNCRWATPTQQGNNRRTNRVLYYEGKRYTLKELAIKYGMDEATLHNRLDKYKLTVEEAVTIPVRRGIYVRNRRTSNTD